MQCRTAGNDLPWSGLCNVVTVVATLTHIYIYHKNVNYLVSSGWFRCSLGPGGGGGGGGGGGEGELQYSIICQPTCKSLFLMFLIGALSSPKPHSSGAKWY